MPTVSIPLQICLPLLAASAIALAILIWGYVRTVLTIRPVFARLLADDWANDPSGKFPPAEVMAEFSGRMDMVMKAAFGYKFDDNAEYRNLVSRARIFYWLALLSFVCVIVSLGLTLQNFR